MLGGVRRRAAGDVADRAARRVEPGRSRRSPATVDRRSHACCCSASRSRRSPGCCSAWRRRGSCAARRPRRPEAGRARRQRRAPAPDPRGAGRRRDRAVAGAARRRRPDGPQLRPAAARAGRDSTRITCSRSASACRRRAIRRRRRRRSSGSAALEALRQMPGVEVAGATSRLPLLPGNSTRGLTIRDLPPNVAAERATTAPRRPNISAAMGIPLLRGRVVRRRRPRRTARRSRSSAQSAAQRFWPDRNPIGERFQIDDPADHRSSASSATCTPASLDSAPQPTVYVPYRQDAWPSMVFTLRRERPRAPASQANAIRDAIWQVDKDQPIGAILTMDEQLSKSLTRRRFSVTLLSAFGVVAVLARGDRSLRRAGVHRRAAAARDRRAHGARRAAARRHRRRAGSGSAAGGRSAWSSASRWRWRRRACCRLAAVRHQPDRRRHVRRGRGAAVAVIAAPRAWSPRCARAGSIR